VEKAESKKNLGGTKGEKYRKRRGRTGEKKVVVRGTHRFSRGKREASSQKQTQGREKKKKASIKTDPTGERSCKLKKTLHAGGKYKRGKKKKTKRQVGAPFLTNGKQEENLFWGREG